MDYYIERINEIEEFLALEKDWQALLDTSYSDSLFVTFEWLKAWWMAFGNKVSLYILLVKDGDGRINGIAPLMKSDSRCFGFPVKKISFMYNDNSSQADFILLKGREKILEIILDYLKLNKSEWDVIEMENILLDSPNYDILTKYLKNRKMTCGIKDGLNSPYMLLNTNFNQYYLTLKKKFRGNLRNITNKLNRLDGYSIKRMNKFDNFAALETVFEISKSSWKSRYKREITSSAENIQFFKELHRCLGNMGWVNVWFLNIKDKAIAYEYVVNYKNRAYMLRADFNEVYKYLSPGTALQMQVIQDSIKEGIKEYDFCGHDDEYKKNWTSQSRPHSKIIIYSSNLYGLLIYFIAHGVIYNLKQFLKKIKLFRELKLSMERILHAKN